MDKWFPCQGVWHEKEDHATETEESVVQANGLDELRQYKRVNDGEDCTAKGDQSIDQAHALLKVMAKYYKRRGVGQGKPDAHQDAIGQVVQHDLVHKGAGQHANEGQEPPTEGHLANANAVRQDAGYHAHEEGQTNAH